MIKKRKFDIIALGISVGGPQALKIILDSLPSDFPVPIVVVQHMSKGFIDGLVDLLQKDARIDVVLAEAGQQIKESTVYIAPDNYHLKIVKGGIVRLSKEKQSLLHIPSIDVMMESVAESFADRSIGVIMTGMGKDGVQGIYAIKSSGGVTIAQDEKTSVVFGMNRMAIESGMVDQVVPLEKISKTLIDLAT